MTCDNINDTLLFHGPRHVMPVWCSKTLLSEVTVAIQSGDGIVSKKSNGLYQQNSTTSLRYDHMIIYFT